MSGGVLLSAGSYFTDGGQSLFTQNQEQFQQYSTLTIEAPFFSQNLQFGDTSFVRIPKKDDVVRSLYLKTTLGQLYNNPSNGWVFPKYSDDSFFTASSQIFDIDPVTRASVLVAELTPTFPYYNTQLLMSWIYYYNTSYTISYDPDTNKFVFTGFQTVGFTHENVENLGQFFGFDIRFILNSKSWVPAPQLNLLQCGWIQGFQPVSNTFKYVDNVAQKIIKKASLTVGGQTIQTFNSHQLITESDLQVPQENQAALTVLVGKNDSNVSIAPRTYWTSLPFDTFPLSALSAQDVQIEVDFETFQNISNKPINTGVLNASNYTLYSNIGFTLGGYTLYKNEIVLAESPNTIQILGGPTQTVPSDFLDLITLFHNTIYFLVYRGDSIHLASYDTQLMTYTEDPTNITGNIQALLGQYILFGSTLYLYIVCNNGIIRYDTTNGAYTFPTYTFSDYQTATGVQLTPQSSLVNGNVLYIYGTDTDPDTGFPRGNIVILQLNGPLDSSAYSTPYILHSTNTPNAGNSLKNIVTDGLNIYLCSSLFDHNVFTKFSNGVFTQFRLDTLNTYYSIPAQLFDGTFVYYLNVTADTIYMVIYDTTKDFQNTGAWSWVTIDGDTGSYTNSLGQTGTCFACTRKKSGSSYIITTVTLSLGIYMYISYTDNTTRIVQIDPYQVMPSIKSSLIIDYAHYEVPVTQSTQLINQYQENTFTIPPNTSNSTFILQLKGPVRELWFQGDDIARMVLFLNGEVLFDEEYQSLFVLRPFDTHTVRTPDYPIAVYSFADDPTTLRPTGTMNLARIGDVRLTVYLNSPRETSTVVTVTARTDNVLRCYEGIGGIVFQ